MDFNLLQEHLTREYGLFVAAIEAAGPAAPVPSCPDWTVADLAEHVALVYLHKAECIRLQAFPSPWPPERGGDPPAVAVAAGWARLTEQFAVHAPSDPAATWHSPDQTVGFWIRRMAQETLIHRIDAQLAAGIAVTPIPPDLARDCIDEVLTLFLAYTSVDWPEDFGDLLAAPDPRPVAVAAGETSWSVAATTAGITVEPDADTVPAATVSGTPQAVAVWLWARGDDGVTVDGDADLVGALRALLAAATQ